MIENTPDGVKVEAEHDRCTNDSSGSDSGSTNRHRLCWNAKGGQLAMFDEGMEADNQTRLLEEKENVNEGLSRLEARVEKLESRMEGIVTRLNELRDRSVAADERREEIFNLQVMTLEGLTTILQFLNRSST